MTVTALLAKVRTTLGAIAPSLTTASAASDLFEAYVFSIVVDAAIHEGATVDFLDVHGDPASPFVFRTSPGHIGSQVHKYGYAHLSFRTRAPLEAHVSVRIAGRSRVLHECDVLVLDSSEAAICRAAWPHAVYPRAHAVHVAIECKHYISNLKLSLAREFLGFDSDVPAADKLFVTNSSSASVEKLLTHKKKSWEHRAIPGNPTEILRLRNALQESFKRYKAR